MSEKDLLMSRLLDGDLSPEERAQAEALLNQCQTSQKCYHWHVTVKTLIQTKCTPIANEAAWSACSARLAEIESTRRVTAFTARHGWAIAASLFGVIVIGGYVNRSNSSEGLNTAQVASISGSLSPVSSAISSDARAEEAFALMRERMGAAVQLKPTPELQATRLYAGTIDGSEATRLEFVDQNRTPFALITIANGGGLKDFNSRQQDCYRIGQLNGQPTVTWCETGYTFVLVGQTTETNVVRVADALRGQTR